MQQMRLLLRQRKDHHHGRQRDAIQSQSPMGEQPNADRSTSGDHTNQNQLLELTRQSQGRGGPNVVLADRQKPTTSQATLRSSSSSPNHPQHITRGPKLITRSNADSLGTGPLPMTERCPRCKTFTYHGLLLVVEIGIPAHRHHGRVNGALQHGITEVDARSRVAHRFPDLLHVHVRRGDP